MELFIACIFLPIANGRLFSHETINLLQDKKFKIEYELNL